MMPVHGGSGSGSGAASGGGGGGGGAKARQLVGTLSSSLSAFKPIVCFFNSIALGSNVENIWRRKCGNAQAGQKVERRNLS